MTVLWAKNDPGGDRDTLGLKRLLIVVLVIMAGEHLVDVVAKMKFDRLVVLSNLHTQKRLHEAASESSDVKILGTHPQKLVLELGTGCCVHYVVNKQDVNNEMLTLALHEDSILAVDCWVAVLFHPVRDVNVSSAGCLLGSSSIDAMRS
jgi:hypothetical protein